MTDAVVTLSGLTKHFGSSRAPVVALEDLDLELRAGEVLGCLGPNGAGKTTMIRLLLGLLRPTRGSARVFGLDAVRDAPAVHRRLAYVPGETNLWPDLTGAQTLRLLGTVHGGVDGDYRDRLIDDFVLDPDRRVRAYSKGNRQKLSLIAALMTRPDLLVLDEPTSGLDPLMEQAFRTHVRAARDRGQTVLLSSHILGEVESLCDRIAILRAGRLVDQGTLVQLRHLSAMHVEIEFAGPAPDLAAVPGLEDVGRDGHSLRCRVQGSMQPLMTALAAHAVVHMTSREPSLEELFLARYGTSPASPEPDATELARVG